MSTLICGPVWMIEMDVGAVGVGVILGACQLDTSGQPILFFELRLQILLGADNGGLMVGLAGADSCTASAGEESVELGGERGGYFRWCAGDGNLTELGATVELDVEDDIGDGVGGIDLDFWIDLAEEVSFLAEIVDEALAVLFHVGCVEGSLRREVGDLDEFGERETFGSRKFENAEIDGRLKDQKNANTVGLRDDL